MNYYFRVRSTEVNDKKTKDGLYGKIYGEIQISPADKNTCDLQFTYYLNPTPGDRNMEFDPKQNLIKDLDSLDKPNNP